ncbi:MAG TPA: 5'-3' exonuclease [Egibacteraceae bacterium]|nr:5'-3' exonuclease [Egibacteraceae bacterium]
MAHRMLLDTSSLFYRAYFALPTSIKAPDGTPVNALRGYLDMTARLLHNHRPDEVLHVRDDEECPAPRLAAFPAYKQHRPPMPEGLPEQFALLWPLLAALGMDMVDSAGWEADDAIGTLCAQAAPGDRVDVVTGDRDLIQLVRDADPPVRLLFTLKGVSELGVFDEAAVRAKYGMPAARYAEFATLRGDPSDGLPGVKGVGEKTALQLVTAYPSLEGLYADLLSQPPGLARKLSDARDYVTAMRDVVPVRRDVALRRAPGTRDDARLDELAAAWNLEAPLRRLREVLDA